MDRSEYEQISYEVDNHVATVTLDRPERLNAFTKRMRLEVMHALDTTDADDDVRVVVVTGRGRGFCAGADLSSGTAIFDPHARGTTAAEDFRDGGGQCSLRVFNSRKPIIAAINGPAVGVGVTITLPMDVRLASEEARFGFVFTRLGLVPEGCSTWFLPRVVGIARAQEWIVTGRTVGAEEALRAGLVHAVHPPDELLARAYEIAREIAEHTSPVAVALARQMLWRMLAADDPREAHLLESRVLYTRQQSPDLSEGVSALKEKRRPRFPMQVSSDLPPLP